ncbi:MAG: hypothetical protein J6W40_04650 [Alphaproteobacteria bacterium]|nr:hypothetical protein [Alphaproteobacteria bacterium]
MLLDKTTHQLPRSTPSAKEEFIQDRKNKIEKFKNEINKIKKNPTLSEGERARKIARFQGFIADYERDIEQTLDSIERENVKMAPFYERLEKIIAAKKAQEAQK